LVTRNEQSTHAGCRDGSPALLTFGAMSDSAYEYLLKEWVQTGKKEEWLWKMYAESMDGMHALLLQDKCPNLMYVADAKGGGRLEHKMDHLACFLPGLLALGVACVWHQTFRPACFRCCSTWRQG
jgi:hypothetical protein